MTYTTMRVAVRGGDLTVGEWSPSSAAAGTSAPTLLAIHGITGSHRAWSTLARLLPGYRIVAPDLRGRGRSGTLPEPYGMEQHAEDVAAVATALSLDRPLVVGHSMGGFVAEVFASSRHAQIRSLLLVDGGLPVALPPGITPEAATANTLGVAKARLSMTFPTQSSYLDLWRAHPAFQGHWSDEIADYAIYDLVGSEGAYRSAVPIAAVAQDSLELFGTETILRALHHLPAGTKLLTAPRGLANETPGLYAPAVISAWAAKLPDLSIEEIADVNHYTIVMGEAGAHAVAERIATYF